MPWQVPQTWLGDGKVAFILGGGASLRGFDVERLRERGHVIAINQAYKIAPWAEVLYFADQQWLKWNKDDDDLRFFKGLKVTRELPDFEYHIGVVHLMGFNDCVPLSDDPMVLAGRDSGSNAINLAYLMGARMIGLLGFDMKPGRWHNSYPTFFDGYPVHDPQFVYEETYIPLMYSMAKALKEKGCEVLNFSPSSKLQCFPIVDIETVLA